MLGRTLQKKLSEHEITIADLPEWDITDDIAFSRKLSDAAPDLVVHCAAMTNVDACESDREKAENEKEDRDGSHIHRTGRKWLRAPIERHMLQCLLKIRLSGSLEKLSCLRIPAELSGR